MEKKYIKKTMDLEESIVRAIEEIAKQERRSLTAQVNVFLEEALKRQREEKNGNPKTKTVT